MFVIIVGCIYEAIGRRTAARDFPPPGKMVDIGGRRIQLDCRGTGSPVVVFESGLDLNGSLSWSKVQDSIAETTRACTYTQIALYLLKLSAYPQCRQERQLGNFFAGSIVTVVLVSRHIIVVIGVNKIQIRRHLPCVE